MAEGAKSEDLWNSYRELYALVNGFFNSDDNGVIECAEVENVLRRNKQCLLSLLHNLPKNAKSREELKKGMEEGIAVKGIGHQVLSKELYQETIIISDMYDMNEFIALDLLCTAQIQMPFYPQLPRGLVAIALYYDSRKYLVSTLRLLVQARTGVSWTLNLPKSTRKLIDGLMDELLDNGLFNRIFELLKTLDLSKEIDKLQANLALGGPKHRKHVTESFNMIRLILADCVFLWSAQTGLTRQVTVNLLQSLKEIKLEDEASGKLDSVTLFLLMAFISAVDLSVLHTREDGEDLVQRLPVLCDEEFVSAILNELLLATQVWACEGLQAVCFFAFSVCLSSLRMVKQTQQMQNIMDYEDKLIDAAIIKKVFEFMAQRMMDNELFYKEEMVYRRVHYLFCDFIVQMYPKVKELRIRADEVSRTIQAYVHEGLELPANLPRYFENLLMAISKLYEKDPLKLQLMLDYWSPGDSQGASFYRAHPRFVSLFKFVQLSGDMLPPSLFVRYIRMLSSLSGCQQAARNCFNMLKQPTNLNNISWDHFFSSFNQYYLSLKQEAPSSNEASVYRHSRMYHKGITPQEIEGLHSVLALVRAVSDNDSFSRIALCEHPGWAPLTVLLGLVSCSVPMVLKADLLLTLASLCKSAEVAGQMWNNLEALQILVTIPSTASFQPRGIQTELDEVESRMEEYPLTRAWLTLMDELTDSGIPRTLGAGPREPGFDPYFTFILNSVFLKFNARSYKNQTEKWNIASMCLKLFLKFLIGYEPELSDFPTQNKVREFNSPPGFHLMLQLHMKSEFFNGLMYVINEGNRMFEACLAFPEQKHLADCTLFALQIIERSLELQTKFFQLLTGSGCPVLLTNMNKLLLTINPRSGKPDYVINILKYLEYQDTIPKHAFIAVRTLILLTNSSLTHSQIINILLSSNDAAEIRNGFVKCLDEPCDDDREVLELTKKAIFQLLNQCLVYAAPNLAHYLFGFDVHKNVAKTVFQIPGVLSTPRTCIHSIFTLIRRTMYGSIEKRPVLMDAALHTLYNLCANGKTAEPTLKFTRSLPNFFKDCLLFARKNYHESMHELNQLTWILKIIAIEFRLACVNGQFMSLKSLSHLLVGLPGVRSLPNETFSLQKSTETLSENYLVRLDEMCKTNFMFNLLKAFDFNIPEITVPDWGFFEHNSLEAYLNSCQIDGSPKLIDIKKLHRNLIEEVASVQGTTALGQRQAMLEEIQKVLLHALNINNQRKTAASMVKFVDSWRQVIQVFSTYTPIETLSATQQILHNMFALESLLIKSIDSVLLPEIGIYLSGTVLILAENLERNHSKEGCHYNEKDVTSLKGTLKANTSTIKLILNKIIEWIIQCDTKSQAIRINLYGALGILLKMVHLSEEHGDSDDFYITRLDGVSKSRLQEEINTIYISNNMFSTFGERLVEVLCSDSTSAQDICKMLAMSCFSLFIALSGNINWISYISTRGYLKHIINTIMQSDNELRETLEPTADNLKSIYIYNAKMAFLARVATTRVGSELLLEHSLLSMLANMKVFDFHPELSKHLQTEDIIYAPVDTRYLQIWQPTLHICNAVLTSLGTDNQMVIQQITNFTLSHLDVVELILRSGTPSLSLEALKELVLLTSIVARTASNDLISLPERPQDNKVQLHRIQKLMLTLLVKFLLYDNTIKEMLCEPTLHETSDRLSLSLEIVANLLLYSRNIIKNHGIDHDSVGVIFQPNLSNNMNQTYKIYTDSAPSLGVIVQHLMNTINYHHKERSTLELLNRKLIEIPDSSTADLKEYDVEPTTNVNVLRQEAQDFVRRKLRIKRRDLHHCSFIVENAMYIIWAHLDYYMLKAIPKARNYGLNMSGATINLDSTLASASEAMWKITTDDISSLKQGLVSIFNDSFCRKLVDTSQGRTETDATFLEVLLRKVKRLIQFVPVK